MENHKRSKKKLLNDEIKSVITQMSVADPSSPEYAKMAENLTQLYNAESKERKLSPDTIAVIIANLVGIVLILTFEKTGVISSKALSFVLRGRV